METSLALLRRPEVEARTGLRRSTIYARIKLGLFVAPVLIGPRAVGFPAGEVEALNRARIAGMDDDSIKKIVKSLHAARRSHGVAQSLQARG